MTDSAPTLATGLVSALSASSPGDAPTGEDALHVRRAWELAMENVEDGGRPFGCVVVDAASA